MSRIEKLCIVPAGTHDPEFEQGVIRSAGEILGVYAPGILEPIYNDIRSFRNGEVSPLLEGDMCRNYAAVVGSMTSADFLQYIFALEACIEKEARRISAVITKLCYDRQDRRDRDGTCNQLVVIAQQVAQRSDKTLLFDPHSIAVQSAFKSSTHRSIVRQRFPLRVVVTEVMNFLKEEYPGANIGIISPDAGAYKMGDSYSRAAGWAFFAATKHRPQPNVSVSQLATSGVIAEWDVAVIIDDLADTLGTMIGTADQIRKQNDHCVIIAACAHPEFSGDDILERLAASEISWAFVANTMARRDTIPKESEEEYSRLHKRGGVRLVSIERFVAQSILMSFFGKGSQELYDFPYDPEKIEELIRQQAEWYLG